MRLVVFGKSLALLSNAVSGDSVATYSSILLNKQSLKQLGQRQSTTSEETKIGGKSLHQH